MFAYYLEGYSNGIKVCDVLTARSIRGLEAKAKRYHVNRRIANIGRVLYRITDREKPYARSSYEVIEQYNAKAFFQYWD